MSVRVGVMKFLRKIYRAIRGVLFTVIVLAVVLYALAYVLLSMPSVQDKIKNEVETELSALIETKVSIESVNIRPFNELQVNSIKVLDKTGTQCVEVDRLGVGIRLWQFIKNRRIEFSYAEIIGLNAMISQKSSDSPLNIQFILDAFKPKNDNTPTKRFDVNLRNVVIRRCSFSFDREWQPVDNAGGKTDFNHFRIFGLKGDLNVPQISNDSYVVDLRRLSFEMTGGLNVETLALKAKITPTSLALYDIQLKLPGTDIRPSDIFLSFNSFKDILKSVETGNHHFVMVENPVTPSDFSWISPSLKYFDSQCLLSVEISGNADKLKLGKMVLQEVDDNMALSLSGELTDLMKADRFGIAVEQLDLSVSHKMVNGLTEIVTFKDARLKKIFESSGCLTLSASGNAIPAKGNYAAEIEINSSKIGGMKLSADALAFKSGNGSVNGTLSLNEVNPAALIGNDNIEKITAQCDYNFEVASRDVDGKIDFRIHEFVVSGHEMGGAAIEVEKTGKQVNVSGVMENEYVSGSFNGYGIIDACNTSIDGELDLIHLSPSPFGVLMKYPDYAMSGRIFSHIEGNSLENITGSLDIVDFTFDNPRDIHDKSMGFKRMNLICTDVDSIRALKFSGDWIDGEIKGDLNPKKIIPSLKSMAYSVLPSIVDYNESEPSPDSQLEFYLTLRPDNSWTEFFNLPFRLLVDVPVSGLVDIGNRSVRMSVKAPYLQQGKNKLVHDSKFDFILDGDARTASATLTSSFPAKKGEMTMNVHLFAQDDNIFTDVDWETPENHAFDGKLSLDASISKDELTSKPEFKLDINPSTFDFGPSRWQIDRSSVMYANGIININGLKIWHKQQFVDISGRASELPEDMVKVRLADIDLGYVFETLNINYVTFGGTATGEFTAQGALGKFPKASTEGLNVKNFSYNGTVLGDAILKSRWENEEKRVSISADITSDEKRKTFIDGGIWVTRDSLSFSFDADRVPIGFISPFMSAFASDVGGRATGQAKLYGTFSDIDLVGKLHADSIGLKIGIINVAYNGSDSVFLYPGRIQIPHFKLFDSFGHSAILSGELNHRYFHDPEFTFKISDARNLLCFDTNPKLNPDWYGRIFGDGNAAIKGWPGYVGVSVDMAASKGSSFTCVLNDTRAAEDYKFLTFTDKTKEAEEMSRADTIPSVLATFKKKIVQDEGKPSRYVMDIRGSLDPSILITLVMDPVAGDKISAFGTGNVQLQYDSENDGFQMFGKYFLDEGNYNFSLQDLILRDFKIKRGSSIAFNGDPYDARLNIIASYRVNTNLTDLDKSFATDRDLARTNVPVDALLMVEGDMQHPDITFDVELPTLTRDVERKVKSIISTDDMMSRQIIYLLALNRFYTPEYMGSTSNGGELASVASSTLSSQLSNMLGQLTDKFTVAPTFRSDKGDFSDIEVDVALSSRLLNNKLLVNGNFGYRDKTTSTTTFVGDFDVEYILSRSGNLRLKAYNHFNDQNYYLRQALTTQGLGVVYRKEFDNPFSFLKRKNRTFSGSVGNDKSDSSASLEIDKNTNKTDMPE